MKALLGFLPIFFIFLLWSFLTTGKIVVSRLPVGYFEYSDGAEGTVFSDRVSFYVKNSRIDYKQINGGALFLSYQTFLIVGSETFDISDLPAVDRSGNVQLTLPAGLIERYSQDRKCFYYKYESLESRILAPVILPSPSEVFKSLPQLWTIRKLPLNLFNSFKRVVLGFVLALIVVFPVSLLMGTCTFFRVLLSPMVVFCRYLPIPALTPLTMCFFGISEIQKLAFLAIGFVIYLLPLFVRALDDVDNLHLQTGYTLGASKSQIIGKIMLPVAMPSMFEAMRTGFGVGWGYIVLAEMLDIGEASGVGSLIITSQRMGPKEDIYLILIAIVFLAFVTDKIWQIFGEVLFPYRSHRR